jgi:hypothetical protein
MDHIHIPDPLAYVLLLVAVGAPLVWIVMTQLRENKERRAARKHLAAVNPVAYGHVLAKEKREKRLALVWTVVVLALGYGYVSFSEQVNHVVAYVVAGAFVAYFVGLPLLLTWAWPVIAIVGLFVLANALFPSKRA